MLEFFQKIAPLLWLALGYAAVVPLLFLIADPKDSAAGSQPGRRAPPPAR